VAETILDLREEMRAVARGERAAPDRPERAHEAPFSPGNLDLLRLIVSGRPATVSDLAAMSGRAQSNVSRALQALVRHGLVRMVRDGRAVRPEVVSRTVRLDLATGTVTPET